MATGNVAGSREERKRGLETVEAARREMESAVARYAAAELASSGGSGRESQAALLDERVRRAALTAARPGLESAFREDRSDCGAANAPACGKCGERMRYVGRKDAAVETALGRARVAMGRYACGVCGKTVRPRRAALDVAVSMTPSARRMASLAGSSCCYAEADGLLAGVNYGAKRIERATRAVGDDLETRREKALSGSITVLGGDGGGAAPRKSLKEGEILSVALDGTGVPARPSETAGRAGKDGAARTREAKVGALWVTVPDGQGGRRTARCARVACDAPSPRWRARRTTTTATRRWRGGCCASWRRRGTRRRTWGCASATARRGCGGCTRSGSRTRS